MGKPNGIRTAVTPAGWPGRKRSRRLFTIGYEKARLADVVATLAGAGIATLIDVRDRPISRRPGFSKRQLEAAIEEAGMRYLSLRALGTPPEGREAGRRREWDRFWHIVETRLAGPEAELALHEAGLIAQQSASACYATRPTGAVATAAASPNCSPSGTVLRCIT